MQRVDACAGKRVQIGRPAGEREWLGEILLRPRGIDHGLRADMPRAFGLENNPDFDPPRRPACVCSQEDEIVRADEADAFAEPSAV